MLLPVFISNVIDHFSAVLPVTETSLIAPEGVRAVMGGGGGIQPEPSSPPEHRRWCGPLVSLGKAFVISVLVIDF